MMVDLPAGLAALTDLDQRSSYAETIANLHLVFGQAQGRNILAKTAQPVKMWVRIKPGLSHIRPPCRIMLTWIEMHRLVCTAMDGRVGHAIALKAELRQSNWALGEYTRTNGAALTIAAESDRLTDQQRINF
jgi:hypothetical protein